MSNGNKELSEFTIFLSEKVNDKIKQSGDRGFREAIFTELIMKQLADAHETANINVCTSIHRDKTNKRLRQMNGYGLWDSYETLDIFIANFKGDKQLYILEKSKATAGLNLAFKYYKHLLKGADEAIEDSSAEKEFQLNFDSFKEQIQRIRLILLTDGIVKNPVKYERTEFENITILTEIWDLERIHQLWSSQQKREPVEIDVQRQFGQRIRLLSIEQENEKYTTYLGIVPGKLLADLYDIYGSRLLEQNVRVYLQSLGKVNKEMRNTILKTPGMFMAYNNGISATATEMRIKKDSRSGDNILEYIKDLQIVNGGQTTSSIYYAYKKNKADLSQVHLQMKITLIHNVQKKEEIVSNISKYANSQNKVSETDLTSNQAFHIALEEISRTTWASPVSGHQQTRWYYERVRGQYKEELNKADKKQSKEDFKKRNPKHQIITKEELAKYRHAWFQLPYMAARGSQKNYIFFTETGGRTIPSRSYFQETAAISIIFREAELLYGKKPSAMGDLRYLAVPYCLSWLNYRTENKIDMESIWKMQFIPESLSNLIKNILLSVNEFLQKNKPVTYALIGEWAKREECWLALKEYVPEDWDIDMNSISGLLKEQQKQLSI